jgi:hypothetical protein
MKKCNVCQIDKPAGAFSRRAASHDGLNYTCRACSAARARKWRDANPGAFSDWHKENKQRRSEYWREWYERNKEARSVSYAEWARNNKHIVNALVARRNAAKLRATPAWADQASIREFYERAAELTKLTGVRHEVDHIYPLQGEFVCGLHCEFNLQILTKTENIRKGNRMPEEVA